MGQSLGDTLTAGKKLVKGELLTSPNGVYTLTLQEDGNLVLASQGNPLWASGTDGQDVVRAEVQPDGNFVVYTADKPVWATDTKSKHEPRLVLQDDRNLVLYAGDDVLWSTKTETDAPPPEDSSEEFPEESKSTDEPVEEKSEEVRVHVVVEGDTLSAIAAQFYGDASKYPQIAEANGIENPDLIHPGQELTIP